MVKCILLHITEDGSELRTGSLREYVRPIVRGE